MRATAAIVLCFLLLAPSASASCDKNPAYSSFLVEHDCDYTRPCLEDQANTLHLRVDTACYPWWRPCASFAFGVCDFVEWDFGDGTSTIVQGSPSVTHVWQAPGYYSVSARVRNANGEQGAWMAFTIVRRPPALVHWEQELYTANENDPDVTLTLVREGDVSRAVTVLFCAGTGAAQGEEWDRNVEHVWDRPVTIPAGVTSVPVKLRLRNDDIYRGEERYSAFVYDYSGETLMPTVSTLAHTELRVLDDEKGPTLSVHDMTVEEGDSGAAIISIPHELSQPLAQDLILWWQIGTGTATRGVDWNTPTGGDYYVNQYLKAGDTRTDLHLEILGDRQAEDDETIVVRLADPMGPPVTLNQPTVTVTIHDDDLYELKSEKSEVTPGDSVPITVSVVKAQPAATTARIESSDPTVLAVPSTVTIPAGALSATFEARAINVGTATVKATFDDGEFVDTTIISTLRANLSLSFPDRVQQGSIVRASITTDPPVPAVVSLAIEPAGFALVPATIALDANGTGEFDVEMVKAGRMTLVATLPPQYGGTKQRLDFTSVNNAPPVITSLLPDVGVTIGGTPVTVIGGDFLQDQCVVAFDDVEVETRWRARTMLIAKAPPHAPGTVSVSVRCGTGTTKKENAFRYVPTKRRAAG
ncbi:MAG TPA: IPT/TIG domain-containing protein [Thermoanaerobaculia bacterium]|nr:IPT/TIG domain-containing protein [Thermoanaerobaculia bacterium]